MTKSLLFRNANLLDPRWDEPRGGYEVLVEGERIKEVSDRPIKARQASVIDCGKRTLMPGLIDCHVHTMHCEVYISRLESMPLTLMAAGASERLRAFIDRGFTTVRDAGGADWGIKTAVESGLIPGPRMFIAGRSIGPTGGHNDRTRRTGSGALCNCANAMVFLRSLADGPDEVRKAAREQIRQGADHIKLMCSGGVASPYDPIDSMQFTVEEITAAVEEANAFGRYTLAHAYTPAAITRAITCGVRTIEHGNLIDAASARLMARKGAYMVANLIAYFAMRERAADFGMTRDMLEKNEAVIDGGLKSLEICKKAGVKVGFGTDLLGQLHVEQSREFLLRREVHSPIEIIRQATLIGAEIVRMDGQLGVIEPGAYADLLVIDGDPLRNMELLLGQGAHMSAIVKGGAFHKNRLA